MSGGLSTGIQMSRQVNSTSVPYWWIPGGVHLGIQVTLIVDTTGSHLRLDSDCTLCSGVDSLLWTRSQGKLSSRERCR